MITKWEEMELNEEKEILDSKEEINKLKEISFKGLYNTEYCLRWKDYVKMERNRELDAFNGESKSKIGKIQMKIMSEMIKELDTEVPIYIRCSEKSIGLSLVLRVDHDDGGTLEDIQLKINDKIKLKEVLGYFRVFMTHTGFNLVPEIEKVQYSDTESGKESKYKVFNLNGGITVVANSKYILGTALGNNKEERLGEIKFSNLLGLMDYGEQKFMDKKRELVNKGEG